MYRTFVILRHTFFEAIAQPIYSLLLGVALGIVIIFRFLPFFTLGEDTTMYKSVCLDSILLLTLLSSLFAASRSVYEEIEDRTMLTLMSKPVARWQVLLGKFLGLSMSSLAAIAIAGAVLIICTYTRVPGDYQIATRSVYTEEMTRLAQYRNMHISTLYPSLLAMWMQVSVLTAISVAVSTRVSLVANLPIVIMLYIAGNLTRFLDTASLGGVGSFVGWILDTILPFLAVFDLSSLTIRQSIERDVSNAFLLQLWAATGASFLYAVCYATFALAVGILLFRSRELGGSAG